MQEEAFYQWLLEKYDGIRVPSDMRSRCKRVENCEKINLDVEFKKDLCESVIDKLTYTKDDENERRKQKHNIPINGNIYNGTHSIKNAVKLYVDFKKGSIPEPSKIRNTQSAAVVVKNVSSSNHGKQYKNQNSDSYIIAGEIEEIFNQINNHYDNYQKKRIFETVPEMQELWFNIRTPCKSDGDFNKFINSLYMLFFETTKNKDPYDNLDKNGYPRYIKRLPEKFTKINTSTYRFMDIVGILRHKIAHLKSKLSLPPWKITYPEALQELLKSKLEPRTTEQFQKLQIEVLNRFKIAMDTLLQIVENDLSSTNP